MPLLIDIVIITIYVILTTIDVTGNFLLAYIIIARCNIQRKPRDMIVLNMVIADLMVGIFFTPRHLWQHAFTHPQGHAGDMLCKFVTGGMLAWIGATASSFCVVVLAFERYFAVIHPFKQRFTIKSVRFSTIASWLYATVLMLPPFFVLEVDAQGNSCIENWTNMAAAEAYSIVLLLFMLIFPLVLMSYLYGRVIGRLWFIKKSATQPVTQSFSVRSRKSVTKMLLIVSLVYIICWSSVLILYKIFGSEWNNSNPWHTVPEALILLYSCFNPIIFIVYSQRFRTHFLRILRCENPNNARISEANENARTSTRTKMSTRRN